jgi:hypothetical protein
MRWLLLSFLLTLTACPERPARDDDDAFDDDDSADDDDSLDDDDAGDDDTGGDDDDATGEDLLCSPNSAFCDGTLAMLCDEDGLTAVVVEDCFPDRVCYGGECRDPCTVAADRHSYLGCEFLAVSTLNSSLGTGFATDFAVVVGAPVDSAEAHVQVSRGGNVVTTRTVQPGTSEAIELPMVPALQQAGGSLFANASSATVAGGAYEIVSDVPVVAYQFNPLHFTTSTFAYSYTNDASLLLPEHALTGTYRVQTWSTWDYSPFVQYRGFAAIAATEDGTTVTITSSAQTAGGDPAAVPEGGVITVNLDRGDVVQVLSGGDASDDLTGSRISATAPVATFVGHDCTYMPQDQAACDHLEEMAFPVETWGALVPITALRHPDGSGLAMARYRVQGRTGGVGLTFEPAVHPSATLAEGEVLDFDSAQDFVITATGQIQVTQTMFGQDALSATSGGDPAMGTGIPWSQTRATYDFLVPTTYTTNWLNVVAPTGTPVLLDGTPITTWSSIGSSGYDAARVSVAPGSHRVVSDDGATFGITAYGYAQYTSYLYPAGLNLLR